MTTRRDGDATRAAILAAAEELFAERGFAGTTISAVAARSGASGPLIVNHFGSKRGLFQAMRAAVITRFVERAPEPEGDDIDGVRDWLERVIRSQFEHFQRNPTIMRLAGWGRLEGDTDRWPGLRELHDHYIAQLERLQAAGVARGDVMPFRVLLMISGAIQLWLDHREHHLAELAEDGAPADGGAADADFVRSLIAMMEGGLRASGRSAPS